MIARPHCAALTLTLTLALAACAGPAREPVSPAVPAPHALEVPSPRELVTRDGAFLVAWTPVGGRVPMNEHFEVDVRVARNDAARTPVEGASLAMSCAMPDHGHGTLTEPRAEEIGGGLYRVRGLLLHMGGYWTVSISVVVDGVAATADDELDL